MSKWYHITFADKSSVLTQDRGYALRAVEKHAVYESRDCMRFVPMKKGVKHVDT